MDALTKAVMLMMSILLASCVSSTVNIIKGVTPDYVNCRPYSTIPDELKKSQAACHHGVAGDGTQIVFKKTTRYLSVYSDTTHKQVASIFVRPLRDMEVPMSLEFDAFYSRGLAELAGNSGCVGTLEGGEVRVEHNTNGLLLIYDLHFELVSPLGWLQDCKDSFRFKGIVDLRGSELRHLWSESNKSDRSRK